MKTHLHRQRGFSMLEALVSMLVMAFGMLAVAALRSPAFHASHIVRLRKATARESCCSKQTYE